jgi:hypothetical protein
MTSTTIYPSTKVKPYVYLCTNRVTGEFYFGYRFANKQPSHIDFPQYKTSSRKVRPLFDQFDWIIVAEFDTAEDAYDLEQLCIHEHWESPLLLNQRCNYGKGKWRCTTKHIPHPWTEEQKAAHSARCKGRVMSAEHKAKLSAAAKQRPKRIMSDEHKAKISASRKGLPPKLASADTREKMSATHKMIWDSRKMAKSVPQ